MLILLFKTNLPDSFYILVFELLLGASREQQTKLCQVGFSLACSFTILIFLRAKMHACKTSKNCEHLLKFCESDDPFLISGYPFKV